MPRVRSILVLAVILSTPPPATAAERTATPVSVQAALAERVLAIKRFQQQQLMHDAYEARGEGGASTELERAAFERRCAIEAGTEVGGGISQRPATLESRERLPATLQRGDGAPATANGTLSYATNRVVNDVTLDTPARADAQAEPSIAAWGAYVMVGWNDGRGAQLDPSQPPATLSSAMNYGYSTDGGQTFITPTYRDSLPVPTLGGLWTSDPVVTVNEKTGDFYYCGLFNPANPEGTEESGLAVARATFSGTTITWTKPVMVTRWNGATHKIDKCWMAVDSLSGNLYVTYTHFDYSANSDSILFTRSTDNGVHWSPPIVLSSNAGAGYVQGSRPAVGPAGEVYVTWKEIGVNVTGQDFMRIRKSTNLGVSFGSEVTAAAFYDNFGTGAPGFNREQSITLPSIAVDRSMGPNRGRVYIAWNESVDYFDSIPDTSTGPVVVETESNDTYSTAQPITPGDAIRGTFSNHDDFDYFRFTGVLGTTYLFWTNEFDAPYTMRIFAADGVTRLAFSAWRFGPPTQSFIAWTCPRNGDYYLRMANLADDNAPHYYRVDTGIDTPGGFNQRARDHRDAFVASSANGTTWSAPVNVTAAEPGWFDDWLPEVAVTPQGAVYALWYDFSDSPVSTSGGMSEAYMARSDDGGVTWASLGPVSEKAVNWTFVNSNTVPNQGDYMGLFANSTGVYPVWTDTEFGTPDIFAAPFGIGALQVEIESVVVDTARVTITWRASGPHPATAEVVRADGAGPYGEAALDTGAFDANGRATFADTTVLGGTQYRYALRLLIGGSQQFMGERTVTTPPDYTTPTLPALLSAQGAGKNVMLAWDVSGARGEAAIQRRDDVSDWITLSTESVDGRSVLAYVDATGLPGTTYRYRLALSNGGSVTYTSETAFSIPPAATFALEGAVPNPAAHGINVAFTLADRDPVSLRLVDLGGRVIASRSLSAPEPGRHVERFDTAKRLRPGVYFVRLTQGDRTRVTRVVVAW